MSTSDLPFVPWESLSPAEKITALEIALRQAQQQLAERNDDEPTHKRGTEVLLWIGLLLSLFILVAIAVWVATR